uniref:Uncharacterized protein n=1 Tax=viral metagenome TaxID=1070528 RepID=A0A2V0RCV1_9ZZZZ
MNRNIIDSTNNGEANFDANIGLGSEAHPWTDSPGRDSDVTVCMPGGRIAARALSRQSSSDSIPLEEGMLGNGTFGFMWNSNSIMRSEPMMARSLGSLNGVGGRFQESSDYGLNDLPATYSMSLELYCIANVSSVVGEYLTKVMRDVHKNITPVQSMDESLREFRGFVNRLTENAVEFNSSIAKFTHAGNTMGVCKRAYALDAGFGSVSNDERAPGWGKRSATTFWLPCGGNLRRLVTMMPSSQSPDDADDRILWITVHSVLNELECLIIRLAEHMSKHEGTKRRGAYAMKWGGTTNGQEWICGVMYRRFADVAALRSFVLAFRGYWESVQDTAISLDSGRPYFGGSISELEEPWIVKWTSNATHALQMIHSDRVVDPSGHLQSVTDYHESAIVFVRSINMMRAGETSVTFIGREGVPIDSHTFPPLSYWDALHVLAWFTRVNRTVECTTHGDEGEDEPPALENYDSDSSHGSVSD